MNIDNMKCFVSLAECLNFTRAAELQHITQTTMSRIISGLEEEIGVSLFYRDSRVVRLTEAGREFYGQALKLIDLYDQAMVITQNAHSGFKKELKIGVGVYEDKLLPYVLKKYMDENADIKISCIQLPYRLLMKQFEHGLLDVIITSDQYMEGQFSFPVNRYLVHDKDARLGLHKENPLNKYDVIPARLLSDQVLITMNEGSASTIRDLYRLIFEVRKFIYVNTFETKVFMINANLGIGLFPSFVSFDMYTDICLKPLDVSCGLRKFYILCKKDRRDFVQNFVEGFVQHFQSMEEDGYRG